MPLPRGLQQLTAYFEGDLESFDLAMTLAGTPFQKRVWHELCNIPYGRAISYAELARRIGQPGSSRAVGGANGRNPISIIVPCHRVIGADGGLGGYGGGLDRKRWLLEHEAEVLARHPHWRQPVFAGAITPMVRPPGESAIERNPRCQSCFLARGEPPSSGWPGRPGLDLRHAVSARLPRFPTRRARPSRRPIRS